jgi:hypothetical protein
MAKIFEYLKTEICTHPTAKQQRRNYIYAVLMHRILHKARKTKYMGLNSKEKVMHGKQMCIIFSVMQSTVYVTITVMKAKLKVKIILHMYIY